jgi:hypothetical protein
LIIFYKYIDNIKYGCIFVPQLTRIEMKTTTSTAASKRLAKSTVAKSAVAYKIVKDLIEGTNKEGRIWGGIIRANYTSGSGRFTSNMTHGPAVARLLSEIGIEFVEGNDSPRGGETGHFIKVTTKILTK